MSTLLWLFVGYAVVTLALAVGFLSGMFYVRFLEGIEQGAREFDYEK